MNKLDDDVGTGLVGAPGKFCLRFSNVLSLTLSLWRVRRSFAELSNMGLMSVL